MFPNPVLFGKTLPLYSILGILGIGLCGLAYWLRARKQNRDTTDALYIFLFAAIGVLFGAKALAVLINLPAAIVNLPVLWRDPILYANTYFGGLIFYGGLIGAVCGAVWYCRKYHVDLSDHLNAAVPMIPFAHAIGRIGCFCAGCCYGKPCDPPLGVCFPYSPTAPADVPLLPIQLFESAGNLILCLILILYARRLHRNFRVLGLYLTLYAVMRSVLELWRGDEVRGFLLGISTSQWISIVVFLCGVSMLCFQERFVFLFRKITRADIPLQFTQKQEGTP